MNKKLNPDEVMCLQMAGTSTAEIITSDIDTFDELYDQNDEYDGYLEKANALLDRQEKLGIVTISCHDADFPPRLKAIGDDCPALIHCLGNISLLDRDGAVAIIGARTCDRQGFSKAYNLAKEYAARGNVIVSGLALGCDTAAHRGAIDAGGDTIAIVATGLDLVHPKENKCLQDEILSHGGLIISEQILGVKANPTRLVARNRLQAALSQAVILAQCPARSGSLHTMRFARKYHKKSLAAVFTNWNEINAGNKELLDSGLAMPV